MGKWGADGMIVRRCDPAPAGDLTKGTGLSAAMKDAPRSAALARSIAWKGSKQLYFISFLLADRDLVDDCLGAYAYFRWADDIIDLTLQADAERQVFIEHQRDLVRSLYAGHLPEQLTPEERMLADLIAGDRGPESGLRSFIDEFLWVLAFDARRDGVLVGRAELEEYTRRLAIAVMDGIQYFIGNRIAYPKPPERLLAVTGAHITHMLRDMRTDIAAGIINLPREDVEAQGIDPADSGSDAFRAWVKDKVAEARRLFRDGRGYIENLDVLRCKLAGIWYCARFERVLDTIERDGYRLRTEYHDRKEFGAWMEMIQLGIQTILRHVWEKTTARFRKA
jgi:phytoene/squalene synthetase